MSARIARRTMQVIGLPSIGRRLLRHRLVIVCWHGLRQETDRPHWLLTPVDSFRAQLAALATHYRIVSVEEGLEHLASGSLREPTCAITFDDGYRSNVELALPLLREAGAQATIYLTTRHIGTPRLLWTTEFELALTYGRRSDFALPGTSEVTPLPPDPGKRAVIAARLRDRLKAVPDAVRVQAMARVVTDAGAVPADVSRAFQLMSWEEAQQAEATGALRFGAHTMTHPILSRLDDATLQHEVLGSLDEVHRRLRTPARTFAYPNGRPVDFDRRAVALLRNAGLIGGMTTSPGCNARDMDRFHLRRVVLAGDASPDDLLFAAALP